MAKTTKPLKFCARGREKKCFLIRAMIICAGLRSRHEVQDILQDIHLCCAIKHNFQIDGTAIGLLLPGKKTADHYLQCRHVDH